MATTSLGRLTLDLAVRLSEFTQGMSRAERETAERTKNMQNAVTSFKQNLVEQLGGTQIGGVIDNLNNKFGSLKGGIVSVGAGLAGLAVAGTIVAMDGLARLAVSTAQADAQLAVFANRANTSVQNFQVLSVAAQGLGVSQEQLSSILADTQEKLGEFSATRGGGAADFFEALKNNTKMTDDQIKEFGRTLQGKDGVEAVQMIKDKLDELGASAQEQRFVLESLASDLGNLSVVFDNGGEILNKYRDALEEAGVIKSKEAIEQSQLLAAQTQAVQQRFSGFKSQLAGQIIPVLGGLAEHFMKGGEKGSAFGGIIKGVGYVAKGVASAIIVISGVIAQFGATVGQVITQIRNVGRMGYAVLAADTLEERLRAISQGFTDMGNDFGSYIDGTINRFINVADGVSGTIENNLKSSSDELTQANLAIMQAQQARTQGLKTDTEAAKENAAAHKAAAKARADAAKSVNISSVTAEAAKDIGVSEKNNPNKIMGYQRTIGYMSNRIDAWCASFVGAALERSGFASTRSASARSYEKYGVAFDKNKLIPSGAIATVARNGGSGRHVFIIEKDLGNGKVSTIEGNYGDKVTRNVRDKSQLITVRIPITKDGKVADTSLNASALKTLHSVDDSEDRELAELGRLRLSVTQRYATQAEKDLAEHHQNIAQIESAFAEGSKERAEYLAKEKERYQQVVEERELDRKLRYAEGEEKITLEYQKKMLQIKRDFAGDETAYNEMVAKAKAAYEEDLANFRWAAKAKERAQQSLIDNIKKSMEESTRQAQFGYINARMRSELSPEEYERWSISHEYSGQMTGLKNDYSDRQDEINAVDERGNFLLEEVDRNALLEQARQEHLMRVYELEQEHAWRINDLDEQTKIAREQRATQAFSSQTEAMKAFFGEQSVLYRGAAAMERGYAVYQAVMNIEKTRSSVYAAISAIPLVGPYLAGPMSVTAAAVQVASAARLKSAQVPSFSGVAHGGMDYIPKETTFLLDKGERVLSPRQNRDLTNYLSQRQKGADNGGVTVNINNRSSADVSATRQPDGSVTIEVVDKMIKQSFGRLSQPNSFESRQIQRHTTARYNRK